MKFYYLLSCMLFGALLNGQNESIEIPAIHSNMGQDEKGLYIEMEDGRKIYESKRDAYALTLDAFEGQVEGTEQGLRLNFGEILSEGRVYYGFIAKGDSHYPLPVYFKRTAPIVEGKADIPIHTLKGKYDMIGWEKSGKGRMGYRVENKRGQLLYDGRVNFTGTGPFEVAPSLIEGPTVDMTEPTKLMISARVKPAAEVHVLVDRKVFKSPSGENHELVITGLSPNKSYDYQLVYGQDTTQVYSFSTAPQKGARTAFTFAYASDSRSGQGGGERDVYGANHYIMKKIMALAIQQGAAFMQFSGDLIDGYANTPGDIELQYVNWKRAVEPFTHYLPVYEAMGNHEALGRTFDRKEGYPLFVDRFPYASESAEAVFSRHFVNPKNGLRSEDGAKYDPNPEEIDFPSYEENVYYYTYDNVAVVVLNSDYFYAPSTSYIPWISGGLHGYIMDQQFLWFEQTMRNLEAENDIDHIFVTLHTPFFPNGGHVDDDMWYDGNNEKRPYVNGEPLKKGIIERRDQLLHVMVNQSRKTRALMTGDEHNFAVTKISPGMPRYPEDYTPTKLSLKRSIYQINNGAAGAPYYAQEKTPWSDYVDGFTTQNALVLIHVNGDEVRMEVLNPDTLEEIYRRKLN